jgi:hypothetical protein
MDPKWGFYAEATDSVKLHVNIEADEPYGLK